MSPIALRWIVLAIIVAIAAAAGFQAGSEHVYSKWLDERGRQAAAAVAIVTRQGQTTERVVTRYRDRVEVQKGIDTTIEKEVVKYVEGKPLALACLLDPRWVQLHDAAAAGRLPQATGGADAPGGGVAAAAALPAITANYSSCHRTADRLSGLQTWVREQYETTNGEALRW